MSSQRFHHLLVANRGEIAVRVLLAARAAGYRTTAVYSEADRLAPHVGLADFAVCIGPAPVGKSYLDADRIFAAARHSGADAVHPGYGMLAENWEFAQRCGQNGLTFIGPSPAAIRLMGDKAAARKAAEAAGVPCVPGYDGAGQDEASLCTAAEYVGFPLMVKAAAGGGGRGMRRVDDPASLPIALRDAAAEAQAAFGDPRLLLERALDRARHIEIQVLADEYGHVIHLGERECSLQRRYQKVVEESPSPAVDAELRAAMGAAAVSLARSCEYSGVGTVEYLLTESGEFYFLEMNTRLQVEHPITEAVTGLDLVQLQLRVAQGEPLPLSQQDVTLRGHAIEARICMERPADNFLPQTGTVLRYLRPHGSLARVDDGVASGQEISPYYDSMVAKLIVWGETRGTALRKLDRALGELTLLGVDNNRSFLRRLLRHPAVVAGAMDTALIAREQEALAAEPPADDPLWALAALAFYHYAQFVADTGPTPCQWGFSNGAALASMLDLQLGDETRTLVISRQQRPAQLLVLHQQSRLNITQFSINSESIRALLADRAYVLRYAFSGSNRLHLQSEAGDYTFFDRTYEAARGEISSGDGRIHSTIAGALVRLEVEEGMEVSRGQSLAVLEAMKLQHHVLADADGHVQTIHFAAGDQVPVGALLMEITPRPTAD